MQEYNLKMTSPKLNGDNTIKHGTTNIFVPYKQKLGTKNSHIKI